MSRIKQIAPEAMTSEQRQVHDEIASGPREQVRGPLAVWLHRPDLADKAQALGRYCRYDTCLPPRLSELAILVTARIWSAEFEWWAHKPIALEAGLSADVVEAIRSDQEPSFTRDDEALVYRFTQTLNREREISDALYREAVATLGEAAVVDLTGLLGYYALISMTLKVFSIEPPADTTREQT